MAEVYSPMKKFYYCFLAIALYLNANAQVPPHYTLAVPAKNVPRFAWTKEKWQGDDKPYFTLRHQILEALHEGTPPNVLIAQYKSEYQQKSADNLRLFAWACSLVLPRTLHLQDTDLKGLKDSLKKSKPPYTYEFQRMRFLALHQYADQNDYTTALGERLYAQNEDDFDLIYYLWRDMIPFISGTKEKALGYARRLIEIAPDRATGYGCMADTYNGAWYCNGKHSEDAKQAIYWNQEYLKHEKRTGKIFDASRENTRLTIAKLQKWLVEQK